MTPIVIFFLVMGFLILLLLFLLRNMIDRRLHPYNWVKEEMLQRDNDTIQFFVKKTKNLQFEFNDGIYNMFEAKSKINPDGSQTIEKNLTTIYREGRFTKIFHVEGNQDPLDFRTGKIVQDAQQSKQISRAQISDFLNTESSLLDSKLFVYIIIGIFVLIVIFLIFKR